MKSIILTLMIMMTALLGFSQHSYQYGSGSEADPYQIWNRNDLNGIRDHILNANLHFKIMADIDLVGSDWEPIANTIYQKFYGKLDGNGKTIFNINVLSGYNSAGLFGYLGNGAVIKNLNMEGGIVRSSAVTDANAGSIAGYAESSSYNSPVISGCVTNVSVEGYGQRSNIGGVIGKAINILIEDCINYGNITINQQQSRAGGIIGYSTGTVMNNMRNYGSVVSNIMYSYMGGIVGETYSMGEIYNSINYGKIITVSDQGRLGGILGTSSNNLKIYDSYNYSVLQSLGQSSTIGGIAGYIQISNPYDTSNVELKNTYSGGLILSTGSASSGGLVGWIVPGTKGNIVIHNSVAVQNAIDVKGFSVNRFIGYPATGNGVTIENNYANSCMLVKGQTVSGIQNPAANADDMSVLMLGTQSLYESLGWDFNTRWQIRNDSISFPYFKNIQATPVGVEYVTKDGFVIDIPSNVAGIKVYNFVTGELLADLGPQPEGLKTFTMDLMGIDVGDYVSFIVSETGKEPSYPAFKQVHFSGGDGKINNPFQIADRSEFEALKYYLGRRYENYYYTLVKDIDLSEKVWIPIGDGTITCEGYDSAFRGKLFGNNKKLTGISIGQNGVYHTNSGLFGYLGAGAYIDNLHLVSGLIKNLINEGYTGSIAGNATNLSGGKSITITGVTNTANIQGSNGTSQNLNATGGIIGYIHTNGSDSEEGSISISKSSNFGNITGSANIGGIAGYLNTGNNGYININNSYSHSNITTNNSATNIGGISGMINGNNMIIEKSYAYGSIGGKAIAVNSGGIAGFINGNSLVENSVAALESISGTFSNTTHNRIAGINNGGILTNNFASQCMIVRGNPQNSDDANSIDGLDKTILQLFMQSTYQIELEWDFDNIWEVRDDNLAYPYFRNLQSSPVSVNGISKNGFTINIYKPVEKIEIYKRLTGQLVATIEEYIPEGIFSKTIDLLGIEIDDLVSIVTYEAGKLSSYPAERIVYFPAGNGTNQVPFNITSRYEMEALKYHLGERYTGNHYILMNDIDLIYAWEPIGDIGTDCSGFVAGFQGKFNGNNRNIQNLNINGDYTHAGLFGVLREGALVENLIIWSGNITGWNNGKGFTGSIAGLIAVDKNLSGDIRITNCINYADISTAAGNWSSAGGIAGSLGYDTYKSSGNLVVENCKNYGNITGRAPSYNYMGGIIGEINIDVAALVLVDKSLNYGKIDFTESGSIGRNGGIVGFSTLWGGSTLTVQRSLSYGMFASKGTSYVGGIMGYAHVAVNGNTINIKDSYAFAIKIQEAGNYIGGIVGYAQSNNGSNINIENTYVSGYIDVKNAYVGGLVGNAAGSSASVISIVNSVAALDSIRGRNTQTNRILGTSSGTVTLQGNYANKDMQVKRIDDIIPVSSTDASGINGADILIEDLFKEPTYASGLGWDFVNIWETRSDNVNFPYFKWQAAPVFINDLYRYRIDINIYRASKLVELCDTPDSEIISTFDDLPAGAGSHDIDLRIFNAGDLVAFINTENSKEWPSYPVNETIKRMPVKVIADQKAICEGLDDIELTYKTNPGSLPFGEMLSGSLDREPGSGAGKYNIIQGDLSNSNNMNFEITFEKEFYLIAPKPQLNAVNDQSFCIGEPVNIPLSYTLPTDEVHGLVFHSWTGGSSIGLEDNTAENSISGYRAGGSATSDENVTINVTAKFVLDENLSCEGTGQQFNITVKKPDPSVLSEDELVWINGSRNDLWNDPDNWIIYSNGKYSFISQPPTPADNIHIMNFYSCVTDPVILTDETSSVANLTIAENTKFTMDNSLINIYGNFNNKGIFSPNPNSGIIFKGNSQQSVTSNGSKFSNITFDKSGEEKDILLNDIMYIKGMALFKNGIVKGSVRFEEGSVSGRVTGNSFIDGNITKVGNTHFIFPLGNISEPRTFHELYPDEVYKVGGELGITPSPVGEDVAVVTVGYYFSNDGMPPWWNSSPYLDENLHHVSDREHWRIQSNKDLASVSLHWVDNNISEHNGHPELCPHAFCNPNKGLGHVDWDNITIASYNGSKWIDLGVSSLTGDHDNGNMVSSSGIRFNGQKSGGETFVTFGSLDGMAPLPVELIDFKVHPEENTIKLIWSTATEINNDYFQIERSEDAINYQKLSIVNGAGNSNIIVDYNYDDSNVMPDVQYYYRLKQVDYDGTFKYSPVRSAMLKGTFEFSVFPNPAKDIIEILVNYDNFELQILNEIGQELYASSNQKTININHLAPGLYIVKLIAGNKILYKKIIKE